MVKTPLPTRSFLSLRTLMPVLSSFTACAGVSSLMSVACPDSNTSCTATSRLPGAPYGVLASSGMCVCTRLEGMRMDLVMHCLCNAAAAVARTEQQQLQERKARRTGVLDDHATQAQFRPQLVEESRLLTVSAFGPSVAAGTRAVLPCSGICLIL